MSTVVNPDTGDGFDAPTPAEAYADAPDLRREMREVMELGAIRDGRRDGVVAEPPPSDAVAADRVYLLRRAALLDPTDPEGPDLRRADVGPLTVLYFINQPREYLYVLDIVWAG